MLALRPAGADVIQMSTIRPSPLRAEPFIQNAAERHDDCIEVKGCRNRRALRPVRIPSLP